MRVKLLAMISSSDEEVQKKLHKEIIQVSNRVDKTLTGLIKDFKGKDKEKILIIQKTYGDFKETRDKKLIPYVFAMETDGALTLASGIQSDRYKIITKNADEITKTVIDNAKIVKKMQMLFILYS